MPVAVRITAARARMGPDDVTYRSVGAAQELDRQSIAEWLDRIGVSGWFRELLDVAFTTEFGQEIDRQSALNFLTTIDPVAQPFRRCTARATSASTCAVATTSSRRRWPGAWTARSK